jgi:ABC-type multidrug transport system permease subunit
MIYKLDTEGPGVFGSIICFLMLFFFLCLFTLTFKLFLIRFANWAMDKRKDEV